MKDYFLFGDNGSNVRVSKNVGGKIRIEISNKISDFDPDLLVKNLGDLVDYLKTYGVKK